MKASAIVSCSASATGSLAIGGRTSQRGAGVGVGVGAGVGASVGDGVGDAVTTVLGVTVGSARVTSPAEQATSITAATAIEHARIKIGTLV
jgi:hypothetical protein